MKISKKIFISFILVIILLGVVLFLFFKNSALKNKIGPDLVIKHFDNVNSFEYGCTPQKEAISVEVVKNLNLDFNENDSHYQFPETYEVLVDRNGIIYTVAWGNRSSIKMYDSNGRYIKTLAKHGAGPGELDGYYYPLISDNDTLIIINQDKQTISLFHTKGDFIAEKRFSLNFSNCFQAASHNNQTFVGIKDYAARRNLVYVFDPDFMKHRTIALPSNYKPASSPMEQNYIEDSLDGIFTVDGSNIYYMPFGRYAIYKYSLKGEIEWIVNRKCEDMPPAFIVYNANENSMFYSHDYLPWLIKLVDGMLVVSTCTQSWSNLSWGTTIDVFSKDGEYLANYKLPQRVRFTDIDENNNLYGVEFNKEGERSIVRYKMTISR